MGEQDEKREKPAPEDGREEQRKERPSTEKPPEDPRKPRTGPPRSHSTGGRKDHAQPGEGEGPEERR